MIEAFKQLVNPRGLFRPDVEQLLDDAIRNHREQLSRLEAYANEQQMNAQETQGNNE